MRTAERARAPGGSVGRGRPAAIVAYLHRAAHTPGSNNTAAPQQYLENTHFYYVLYYNTHYIIPLLAMA